MTTTDAPTVPTPGDTTEPDAPPATDTPCATCDPELEPAPPTCLDPQGYPYRYQGPTEPCGHLGTDPCVGPEPWAQPGVSVAKVGDRWECSTAAPPDEAASSTSAVAEPAPVMAELPVTGAGTAILGGLGLAMIVAGSAILHRTRAPFRHSDGMALGGR